MFYPYVAYVCNDFQVFLDVFVSVLDACFIYFSCLLLYVAGVVSGCFKSRLGCCTWDTWRKWERVRGMGALNTDACGRRPGSVGPMWLHGNKVQPRASVGCMGANSFVFVS